MCATEARPVVLFTFIDHTDGPNSMEASSATAKDPFFAFVVVKTTSVDLI